MPPTSRFPAAKVGYSVCFWVQHNVFCETDACLFGWHRGTPAGAWALESDAFYGEPDNLATASLDGDSLIARIVLSLDPYDPGARAADDDDDADRASHDSGSGSAVPAEDVARARVAPVLRPQPMAPGGGDAQAQGGAGVRQRRGREQRAHRGAGRRVPAAGAQEHAAVRHDRRTHGCGRHGADDVLDSYRHVFRTMIQGRKGTLGEQDTLPPDSVPERARMSGKSLRVKLRKKKQARTWLEPKDIAPIYEYLGMDLSERELSAVLRHLDVDMDGRVDVEDFVSGMTVNHYDVDTHESIEAPFAAFAKTDGSNMCAEDLVAMREALGDVACVDNDREVDEIMRHYLTSDTSPFDEYGQGHDPSAFGINAAMFDLIASGLLDIDIVQERREAHRDTHGSG